MDYHSMSFFPVLAVFLHNAQGLCQQGSLAASAVHRGKEILAEPFEIHRIASVSTLINCGRFCLARSECKSFAYNGTDGTCKAFSITSRDSHPLQTSSDSTMAYVEADQLPKILVGSCGSSPCQPFEACVEESPTTYRCAAIGEIAWKGEMGDRNSVDNWTSEQKASPSDCIEDNIHVMCRINHDPEVIVGKAKVVHKTYNGSFQDSVFFSGGPDRCPTPPALTNADLVNAGYLEAHYMCSEGFINVRATTNTIFTNLCNINNNTWTTPNYKCSDTKDCYYYNTTKGRAIYSGVVATTESGKVCRDWSSSMYTASVIQASLGAATVADVRNYCRDADEDGWTFPWCYIDDWSPEECGIPEC